MSASTSGKLPISIKTDGKSLMLAGKACVAGNSGPCVAVNAELKSPLLDTVNRNITRAIAPQYDDFTGKYRGSWLENGLVYGSDDY